MNKITIILEIVHQSRTSKRSESACISSQYYISLSRNRSIFRDPRDFLLFSLSSLPSIHPRKSSFRETEQAPNKCLLLSLSFLFPLFQRKKFCCVRLSRVRPMGSSAAQSPIDARGVNIALNIFFSLSLSITLFEETSHCVRTRRVIHRLHRSR